MMTTSFSALLNFNVFNSHVFTRLQAKQRNQLFGAKTNGPPMAQRGVAARRLVVSHKFFKKPSFTFEDHKNNYKTRL